MPEETNNPETAFAGRSRLGELRLAIGFLTRLPVVGAAGDLASAGWAFPLAGLLVGAISSLAYWFAIWLGLTALIAAALAVAAGVLATGALHEDGLADFADGLGVRGGPSEKLAAMRASGIGSFGVLALIFGVLLRVLALAALIGPAGVGPALIGAHTGARALLPWAMRAPLARADGLAVSAGRPGPGPAFAALLIGLVILILAVGFSRGVIAALASLLGLAILPLAHRRLGGITGDVLGAIEQLAEIAILLSLVASRSLVGRSLGGL
ncbi:MAG TPA: adenosylcobinamide-GDP ribazoletransferase [Dongiaceae bacterium]|nr:adenosylcobinamide-GDP ribazoletransferase [Dongiaceae bacterium]